MACHLIGVWSSIGMIPNCCLVNHPLACYLIGVWSLAAMSPNWYLAVDQARAWLTAFTAMVTNLMMDVWGGSGDLTKLYVLHWKS